MPYNKETANRFLQLYEKYGNYETAASAAGVTVDSFRRGCRRAKEFAGKITGEDHSKPTLVFGCIHMPYHASGAINHLKNTYDRFDCGSIVCVGDFFDFHSMSRHVSELDASSPEHEYQMALESAYEFGKVFPHGTLVLGNHDLIPQRMMKECSLATSMLKNQRDLYGLPEGWRVEDLFHVLPKKDVLCEHGVGSMGMAGAKTTAIAKRTSYAQAHAHSKGGVLYSSNHLNTIFGMNVGCLVDHGSLAAKYGKYNKERGTLGCGVVFSSQEAYFVPMPEGV